jgi:hypothetical protein
MRWSDACRIPPSFHAKAETLGVKIKETRCVVSGGPHWCHVTTAGLRLPILASKFLGRFPMTEDCSPSRASTFTAAITQARALRPQPRILSPSTVVASR